MVVYDQLKDLSVHDAFTIVAVYAAQLGPEQDKNAIKCIEALIQKHPLFDEINASSREIISRINLFANHMAGNEPMKVIEMAAEVLNRPLRAEAFRFATEVTKICKADSQAKAKTLFMLATKLNVEKELENTANG